MIRRVIYQLNRLADDIGKLHHATEKLRPPTATLWPIIHFDLKLRDLCLLLLFSPVPLGFKAIYNKVTRFVRTAKGQVELRALFIDNTARCVFLFTTKVMI